MRQISNTTNLVWFYSDVTNNIDKFYQDWVLKNRTDPEAYPLSMPDAEWWEHFLMYMENDNETN